MQVNVLGTTYSINESDKVKDRDLEDLDGYCDFTLKSIVLNTFKEEPGDVKDLDEYRKKVLRHELIHAFLYESGLDACSWGRKEEIVDWIAIQFPKMLEIFNETKCL